MGFQAQDFESGSYGTGRLLPVCVPKGTKHDLCSMTFHSSAWVSCPYMGIYLGRVERHHPLKPSVAACAAVTLPTSAFAS